MTPESTPSSLLRNLLQEMQLLESVYEAQGEPRIPLAFVSSWAGRLKAILEMIEEGDHGEGKS